MSIKPRNNSELELIRESGRITGLALKKVLENIKVGVSSLELDKIAEAEMARYGAGSSFKSVRGYQHTTCITFNEEVVHGIPKGRRIEAGDLVGVDLGAVYKGWHTDAAWTVLVESQKSKVKSQKYGDKNKFLKIGEEALWLGIKQAIEGNRIGDIASAIQKKVESEGGYSVVRSLVGHGVGKELHEEPEVPGYGKAGTGLVLREGMALAIEVIYTMGGPDVVLSDDRWTIISADGSLGGLFEMSVIVGKKKAIVLTDWKKV